MKLASDFIKFALSHARRESIPEGARLPLDAEECGCEPWEYLWGTTGAVATEALLNERFSSFYGKKGWTREAFDIATENWTIKRVRVTDCQGLLDCFLGTDVNANYCYQAWCTEKGGITSIERAYEIGEAVFYRNGDGRMTHVGFICGFGADGEPLAVEARGIRYGVCVTRVCDRPWTHRGLVTRKLEYNDEFRDEPLVLCITSPMIQGEMISHLQKSLNALGYFCGAADGKCGRLTLAGVKAFVAAHAGLL